MIPETCGVICVLALMVWVSSTGGLVRAGRLSCAARNRITNRKTTARSTFSIRLIWLLGVDHGLDRERAALRSLENQLVGPDLQSDPAGSCGYKTEET